MISEKVLEALEYGHILQDVAGCASAGATKQYILSLRPAEDFEGMRDAYALTEEAYALLFRHMVSPLSSFDEARELFDKLKVLSTLTPGELLRVAGILRCSRICRHSIEGAEGEAPHIRAISDGLLVAQTLEKQIGDAILNEEEISDHASDKLYDIRRSIRKCNQDIRDKLASVIKGNHYAKYLQDSIITMRNGRYVVPVKQEYRTGVAGLVHDQSATRSTVFIEPMQVVELNNTLRTLELSEQAEIEHILYELTCSAALLLTDLEASYERLILLDSIFAKARYADKIRGKLPLINSEGRIRLRKARHPLIAKDSVVPIDIELGGAFSALVVTGPNTGGKTVCLKTAGLFSLMAMTGLYLPAEEESEISFFKGVFCDIGDEQSIENSLSTFSSHMANITAICAQADGASLVLLDEVGAGTDPDEGAALAIAIVHYLKEAGAKLIVTTHYGALKEYSMREEGVENASMEFDAETLAPTYRLKIGIPGSSRALDIALRLGLKPEIVERARQGLSFGKKKLDAVLEKAERLSADAERQRQEAQRLTDELTQEREHLRAERDKLAEKREKLLEQAKAEARRIVRENTDEAERLLSEIRSLLNAPEVDGGAYLEAAKRKRQIEAREEKLSGGETRAASTPKLLPFSGKDAQKGQRVYIKSMQAEGVLQNAREKNGKYSVAIGSMIADVRTSDLSLIPQKKEKERKVSVNVLRAPAPAGAKSEINLLGQTAYEAESNVEEFLEAASLAGLTEVRIIHGIGTGKLREAVQSMLRRHPLVTEFRLGRYGEGEGGVTVVTLK